MQPIVKQPIHNINGKLWAYEILYSKNEQWTGKATDEEAASALEALISQFSTKDVLENRIAFVTFTQNLLIRNVPNIFAPSALVLQFEQDALLQKSALNLLESYRSQGYSMALVGFEFNSRCLSALNMADYIKLSFRDPEIAAKHDSVTQIANKLGKKVIAYHVDSKESYELAVKMGVEYMQGVYVAASLQTSANRVDHLEANFFELMTAILKDEPDMDVIERIISRDVTLTYSLLRLVNSAFFALRTRVQSVHQALVILGLSQLKQWIYLLSFKHDGNVPMDFIKLSLMRANFAEALYDDIPEMSISKPEAYLMGMFSTLGALLQRPLEEVLSELSLAEEVKEALLFETGKCGQLYKLVVSYESGDWHSISAYAEELGIPAGVISQRYFECMDTISELWRKILN